MSCFMKEKRKYKMKFVENGIIKLRKKNKEKDDDEVTSDSGEDTHSYHDKEITENEQETAQEKRLRLAKIYIEEIEKQENEKLQDKSDAQVRVLNRLKEDYLKEIATLKAVADQYTGVDLKSLNILKCKEHKQVITCVCISEDNKYIFSGSKDGQVVKWSLTERKKIGSISFNRSKNNKNMKYHFHSITCLALSSDFKYLAVGSDSCDIKIWNPETLKHIYSFKHHRNSLTALVFRKNTHYLYSCSKDKSVKVWTLDEMSYLETLFGHQDSVMSIDCLASEQAITAGGMDSSIRIWKIAEDKQLIFNGTGTINCAKFMNEEYFISGGDGEMCVWGTKKKKPLYSVKGAHGIDEINGQPLWITSVASLVNTDLIASGSLDGSIRLWKVFNLCKSISPLLIIPAVGFINSMQFTTDGNYLVVGVGREYANGRWKTIKNAKNGIMIISLDKSF